MSGLSRYDAWKTHNPAVDDHGPDPVECDGTCRCSGVEPCRWFEDAERCGYVVPLLDSSVDIEVCDRCEGSGMYVPEAEEDVPELDDDF